MAPHPGQIIAEELLVRCGLSARALAETIEVSPSVLVEVVAERLPVTRDLAERLGAAFGPSASYWQALQGAWDREQYLARFSAGPRTKAA